MTGMFEVSQCGLFGVMRREVSAASFARTLKQSAHVIEDVWHSRTSPDTWFIKHTDGILYMVRQLG